MVILRHSQQVPKKLVSSVSMFTEFVKNLTNNNSSHGYSSVIWDLMGHTSNGCTPGLSRAELVQLLAKSITVCVGIQSSQKQLFLAHKAVADVEAVFPGFAGEVTVDSVHLGPGSTHGLDSIIDTYFEEETALKDTSTAFLNRMDKFKWVHQNFMKQMVKLNKDQLEACGFERHQHHQGSTCIVSIKTWREFSMTDTEHILCKLWLSMMATHASRNVSGYAQSWKEYCWPGRPDFSFELLPIWEKEIQGSMKRIHSAFEKVLESNESWPCEYPDFSDSFRFKWMEQNQVDDGNDEDSFSTGEIPDEGSLEEMKETNINDDGSLGRWETILSLTTRVSQTLLFRTGWWTTVIFQF